MRKIVYFMLIMLLTVVCIPVHAKGSFYADQNLKLNKEYDSTIFAAGNNVKVTGKVDGISFIAGNDVVIENERDYLFAAGNTVNIKNVTTKDAFIAGSSIDIDNSTIRDLYATAEEINITSEITGKAYLAGSTVTINSTIQGDVKIDAENIKLGENAVIDGTLRYPENVKIDKDKTAKINKEKPYKVESESKSEVAKELFTNFITSVLSMILIGLVLLALNKNVFKKFEKYEKTSKSIITTTLFGLLSIIIVPIATIILLISTIGIGLGIISFLIFGIMFYLSAIPTSYIIGNWIIKDKIESKYLVLIISILVLYVLRLIPVIGSLVTLFSLCFGLGVYINLIKKNVSK